MNQKYRGAKERVSVVTGEKKSESERAIARSAWWNGEVETAAMKTGVCETRERSATPGFGHRQQKHATSLPHCPSVSHLTFTCTWSQRQQLRRCAQPWPWRCWVRRRRSRRSSALSAAALPPNHRCTTCLAPLASSVAEAEGCACERNRGAALVGELLSEVGQRQAEQQRQIREFQNEVQERTRTSAIRVAQKALATEDTVSTAAATQFSQRAHRSQSSQHLCLAPQLVQAIFPATQPCVPRRTVF
jgi:hypothetical protein